MACTPTAATPPPGITGVAATVSFKTTVAPLLKQTCVSCHDAAGKGARDLIIVDGAGQLAFSTIKQRAGAILREVRGGAMPEGGPRWTAEQVAAFQSWQAAGAPDN